LIRIVPVLLRVLTSTAPQLKPGQRSTVPTAQHLQKHQHLTELLTNTYWVSHSTSAESLFFKLSLIWSKPPYCRNTGKNHSWTCYWRNASFFM